MKPFIEMPPKTIMEVYKSLPEGTLAEVIDNQIYMSPSPVFNHQDILIEIASQIRAIIKKKGGKIVIAPFDVYLDETRNAVQPDIVVILNSNKGTLNHKGHFHGVPDLLVEILSPGNKDYDLIRKKDLYESFGVREYMIIDPDTRSTMVFMLENSKYKLMEEDTGTIKSILLDCAFTF